ncbi:Bug family tripartite tricarboxylate transporter substrate binding protein [Paracraurococcus lichenis]|uniref:Tripartite tricarboxylate transporter substrate binding protein n=1 Tax=Paracraurococcus lichenis TaxID=3064888 RepID=A0ABT9E4F3_9PROT|nr:tripartite tricarboxylate transporter substrate binding protein [Paracraurococcus sp. LOR1-02]MDO9711051.1 tripartite tricarboxylate transporter substrate binding protein [Paracraurococcus sp. LOR1-02]
MIQRRHLLGSAGAAGLLAAPGLARAQAWPARPVTLVVPWAAGGGTDIVARIFAQGFEQELKQPVNVVNRTGGGGITGHSAVATAAPDGYTIGTGTSEFANYRTLGLADLGPEQFDLLSRIAALPAGVTVSVQSGWGDVAAFARALKESPRGRITGSGVGTGGAWHLAAAGLCRALGLEADRIRWIPSNGGAPALQDLVAGGIGVFTGSPIEAQSLAAAGRVKVLAVMGEQRLSTMPDVPTLREAGLPWAYANWFSLVAPKGIPAPLREVLLAAAQRAHARAEVQDQLRARGIVPVWDGPQAFAGFVANFAETSAVLLRELGLAKA